MSIGDAVIDPWTVIQPDEFRARQDRVRARAAEQGFDGALVWSRGGAFMDMYADVLYLTGHYSQQPYMGDEAGIGTARSHGVCVLPAERARRPSSSTSPGGARTWWWPTT